MQPMNNCIISHPECDLLRLLFPFREEDIVDFIDSTMENEGEID